MNTSTQNTEHTPGHWQARGPDVVSDGVIVANCYGFTKSERHSNAVLIASAPTLLADNQRLREQVAQLTKALRG